MSFNTEMLLSLVSSQTIERMELMEYMKCVSEERERSGGDSKSRCGNVPAMDARGGGGSRNTATTNLGISAARHVSTVEVVGTNRVNKM